MSIWNAKDDRIDSWDANLTPEIFEVVKKYRSERLTIAELFGVEEFMMRRSVEETEKQEVVGELRSYQQLDMPTAISV